jgi:hypothetical protein
MIVTALLVLGAYMVSLTVVLIIIGRSTSKRGD